MISVKVVTCNARGMLDKIKRRKLFVYNRLSRADVIFLQETHSSRKDERFWKAEWGGNILFSHGTNKSKGVAICFNKKFEYEIVKVERDEEGRYILCMVKVEGVNFLLVNVYGPNDDDPEFFNNLMQTITTRFQYDELIMGGDFNVYLNPHLDRKGGKPVLTKAAATLNEILEQQELVDVWRYSHQGVFQYTWKQKRPFIGSRLDFFLVPMSLLSSVRSCEIVPGCESDHLFVFLEIETEPIVMGRGFWKFNTTLLEDKKFIDQINEIIEFYLGKEQKVEEGVEYNERKQFDELNEALQWETLKMKIISFAQHYSREKASARKTKIVMLKDQLSKAEKRLAMVNLSSQNAMKYIAKYNERIDRFRAKLNEELEYIAKGAILRSKINWYIDGEHNSKYFLNLEKHRSKNKCMSAAKTHSGDITRNPVKILDIQAEFYKKLYTKDNTVKFTYSNQSEQKLTEDQRNDLEKDISQEEIGLAIAQMARNKTPGSDGLPIDFYKVFYCKIKKLLLGLYNFCLITGRLHISARRGIITLIPKKSRDLLLVKSWRPISLLSADYKVISKVISNRIKPTLNNILHQDQSGFMEGRNIATNIKRTQSVVDYATRRNISAVLILVDFEKAFDRVSYESLFAAFEFFNFGPKLVKWLRLLFTDMELCTVNAGNNSPWWSPTRGLFQGNPLGPFGFNVLIEILAINIRQNQNIKGIKIGNVIHLLSLFADDLSLYLPFDNKVWQETMNEFALFEKNSGLKINYDKTVVYRLGSIRNTNAKFYSQRKIDWPNEPVNVLGYWVSHNHDEQLKLNLNPLIDKVRAILSLWYHRGLSLFGKVLVLNSLVSSLFVHKLAVLTEIPDEFFKMIRKIYTEFIWDNKSPKVRWEILIGLKEHGGTGLIDLKNKHVSLAMSWVPKIKNSEMLNSLANEALGIEHGLDIWSCSITQKDMKPFFQESEWKEVLKYWLNYSVETIPIKQQIIWLNSAIKINGKIVFYPQYFKAGMVLVADLWSNEENAFKTHSQIENEFGKIPFTAYLGILKAIPDQWKVSLREGQELKIDDNPLMERCKGKKVVSILYKCVSSSDSLVVKNWQRWVENGMQIEYADYIKSITKINRLTNVVKLRSFQYRLMLGSTITNVNLFHFGIKDTKLCTFCNVENETKQHLFYECDSIVSILHWFNEFIEQNLSMTTWITSNLGYPILNTLSLIAKYFVYTKKCLNERPELAAFLAQVKQIKNLEERIARQKDKLAIHERKWTGIML